MSAYKYNLHSQINLSFKPPPPFQKKKEKEPKHVDNTRKYNRLTQ